jgi:hypothetical protein
MTTESQIPALPPEAGALAIITEIRVRQARLGTTVEAAEDFERVCELAHALNNWRTAQYLRRQLTGGGSVDKIDRF